MQPTLKIMRAFVNGPWRREYDNQGRVHYPELDRYYSSPTRLWNSCFYTDKSIDADLAPESFECAKEVDPAAMRSRIVPNLYFAGELLDVDAHTGGYNLQIAWATGALSGHSAAEQVLNPEPEEI